jgi:hypothetical protein
MVSVSFDPLLVLPLPKDLLGAACSECDKPQAVWKLTRSPVELPFICSLCLLYKSRWAEENVEPIAGLIQAVEGKLGKMFDRDEKRCLVRAEDADRIMFAIVATNRAFSMRDRMEKKANS